MIILLSFIILFYNNLHQFYEDINYHIICFYLILILILILRIMFNHDYLIISFFYPYEFIVNVLSLLVTIIILLLNY